MDRFDVVITPSARTDLFAIVDWWTTHRSPKQAEKWFDEISQAIDSLAVFPYRCPLVEGADFGREVRTLLFGVGGRKVTHCIYFGVAPKNVQILRIRHTSQIPITDAEGLS
ncbi:type II toxin-antitoxin system RelE/ParE family toxin [Roseiconus nitratireducens]|uniref:Type II toxin-antitoxin system RelE/ParE family toxin n=1 Tax=Roseiconus nitratireducens TaxID=2605748 RepID=A0A5M6CXQ0_9BACT|nr:type II toxin-antitoxin system RelE/ParE family toxin [Roseiconus nitratireducens]KAA5539998.1 type II toxin-antitoxin system RelE/ParE family toxin [Roseiconus nitratireducens]